MKKISYFILVTIFALSFKSIQGQDVNAKLSEAETAYNSGNLDNARFALQEALSEINQLIGKDLLKTLPAKMGEMAANEKEDNVSGAAGFAGLSVIRTYGKDEKNAQLEIMGDSPLLASINAILSLPMIMGGSDPNQKRIKLAEYKGIMQKETSENTVTGYTIQVPLNQTLLTFKVKGAFSENEVMSMAQTIPVSQIAKISQ